MPWGRGGAGNIAYANEAASAALKTSQARAEGKAPSSPTVLDQALARDTPDLEAQRDDRQQELIRAEHEENVRRRAEAQHAEAASSGYGLSGRGGAGNWYDRGELARDGKWVNGEDGAGSAPVDVPGGRKVADEASAPPFRGRGGAGNFASDREVLEGMVEPERVQRQDEESNIAMPQEPKAAYLGGRVRDVSGVFGEGQQARMTA